MASAPMSPSSSPRAANAKSVCTSGMAGTLPTVRQAGAQPGAQDAAPAERVQRPDDLVARTQRVGPGVEPDVDPGPDMGQLAVEQRSAEPRTGRRPSDHVRPATGGDVQQRQEHAEEQQRRAEVPLDDDHRQRDAPHREHRQQVRQRRQRRSARDACWCARGSAGCRPGTPPGTPPGSPSAAPTAVR